MIRRPVPLFVLVSSLIVAMTVVVGFYLNGWPDEVRARRLDQIRSMDLWRIVSTVDRYWRSHGKLPADLQQLPVTPRKDPESGLDYEYRPTGPDGYEVCAVFSGLSDKSDSNIIRQAALWRHGAGRACFAFDVRSLDK